MNSSGIQSFRSPQQSSFLDKATQHKKSTAELSGEEQKMIKNKFSGSAIPLEFYEGSGAVRTEQPAARGSKIDLTV